MENLRAALPEAQLTFLDYSPKTAGKTVAKMAAASGVAEWVKSIGGTATVENGSLVEAVFTGTSISDEGLKNLEGLPRLRKIVLDGAEVGDLGMQHLVGLSALTELSLNGTGVSDAGLEHLGRLTSLRKLQLNNTLIEGAGSRIWKICRSWKSSACWGRR